MYMTKEYILGLVFPRTVIAIAVFVTTLIVLYIKYITTDLIRTLFDVPPDIFTESALPIWKHKLMVTALTHCFWTVDSSHFYLCGLQMYIII